MGIETLIRTNLSSTLKYLMPEYYWKRKIDYFKKHYSEIEMRLLPILSKKEKISLDIGAASGSFLVNLLETSNTVIGFEPIPENVLILNEMISYSKINAMIESVALSDKNGTAILSMIENDLGRSTIEASNILEDNTGSNKNDILVSTKKLDDYCYNNIGFIKIDVEGHELSVLQGSELTIKKNMPNFLIEIEERHKSNSINDVTKLMSDFGYDCFFIFNRELLAFSEFDISAYQNSNNIGDYTDNYKRKGIYINNFIFLPQKDNVDFFSEYKNYL